MKPRIEPTMSTAPDGNAHAKAHLNTNIISAVSIIQSKGFCGIRARLGYLSDGMGVG